MLIQSCKASTCVAGRYIALLQVREAAGDAFAVLFRGGAGSLVEGMLPDLLEGLHSERTHEQSVKGLEVRTRVDHHCSVERCFTSLV
jgi:hypothetical protein